MWWGEGGGLPFRFVMFDGGSFLEYCVFWGFVVCLGFVVGCCFAWGVVFRLGVWGLALFCYWTGVYDSEFEWGAWGIGCLLWVGNCIYTLCLFCLGCY